MISILNLSVNYTYIFTILLARCRHFHCYESIFDLLITIYLKLNIYKILYIILYIFVFFILYIMKLKDKENFLFA